MPRRPGFNPWKRSVAPIPCAECGVYTRNRDGNYKKRFCDQACRDIYLSKRRTTANCLLCGKEVHRTPSKISLGGPIFCSRACKHKGQTAEVGLSGKGKRKKERLASGVQKLCLGWCGKMIYATPYKRLCEICTMRAQNADTGFGGEYEAPPPLK